MAINLKDTRKAKFGSIEWQEMNEHNINEKMKYGEEFGPGEKAFIRHNQEWRPKDVELTFKKVNKDDISHDKALIKPTQRFVQTMIGNDYDNDADFAFNNGEYDHEVDKYGD